MLPFYRKIRWQLARDNQFLRYARYAIGEIVLVVIGILIALQINEWNEERLKKRKEYTYLTEIKKNLIRDTVLVNRVLNFNTEKRQALDRTFKMFERSTKGDFNLNEFNAEMPILTSYNLFIPVKTAFNNLLDVEKIDLISNLELRTLLSEYYNADFNMGTQEVIKSRTREFTDYAGSKLTTRERILAFSTASLAIKTNAMSEIYKDEKLMFLLLNMGMTMGFHNNELLRIKEQITSILLLLDSEIESSPLNDQT